MTEEWTLADDGLLERAAARVVVLDPDGKIFLIKGHDSEDVNHEWWFTVGGGLADGEEPRAGAARELFEETGLAISPQRLIGPVLERTAIFRFTYANRRQFEKFYLLHVDRAEARLLGDWNQDHLTDLELDVLDEVSWWDLDDLQAAHDAGTAIYPQSLAVMARSWLAGWDGTVISVDEP